MGSVRVTKQLQSHYELEHFPNAPTQLLSHPRLLSNLIAKFYVEKKTLQKNRKPLRPFRRAHKLRNFQATIRIRRQSKLIESIASHQKNVRTQRSALLRWPNGQGPIGVRAKLNLWRAQFEMLILIHGDPLSDWSSIGSAADVMCSRLQLPWPNNVWLDKETWNARHTHTLSAVCAAIVSKWNGLLCLCCAYRSISGLPSHLCLLGGKQAGRSRKKR